MQIIQIFFLAFLVNLLWEVLHSQLYVTCLEMSLKKYIPLIVTMSMKDAFFICIFYLISLFIFGTFQPVFFAFLGLTFSFIDERISVQKKRWKYAKNMPIIFGVGLTPLLEIAVTGIVSILLIIR